jgi:hypothetical protein
MSAVSTIYYVGASYYTNFPFALPDQFPNPDLRWEKTGMLNVGVDFAMKNNILSGSIEYYRKKGKDLLGKSTADYTAVPNSSIIKNVANMLGNGLEMNLNARIIDKIFKWNTTLIYSYKTNKVTRYYLSSQNGFNYVNSGGVISPIEGKPLYSIISYKWGGLDPQTGDPQGFMGKQISKDYSYLLYDSLKNLVLSGPATPTSYGYFNNSFSWKRLSLTSCISYKFGYFFRKQSISYSDLAYNWKGTDDFSKRWQKPGDEIKTMVPSLIYPLDDSRDAFYSNSETLVKRADNIRFEYINLGYSFNNKFSQKLHLSSLTVYTIIDNLGIIWKANHENIDPDYSQEVPPSKSITFGLKVIF